MATTPQAQQPSPIPIFETLNAYQRTAALKAAIELEVFTAIAAAGEGRATANELAERCKCAQRGMRILCDYLVVMGFLTKVEARYGLTPESALYLDRSSPAYLGSAAGFLTTPQIMDAYRELTGAVRKGGTMMGQEGSVEPENPIWIEFARSMAPMMAMPAQMIAKLIGTDSRPTRKVLDIAAGHGLFGINVALKNPQAEIFALDWPAVLEVAKENAQKAGVSGRYHTLAGSAFEVDFGAGYDVVLLTNFLHHFDAATCEGLLRRVHAALGEGGRAVTFEFVPNEDRVTPPQTAGFAMIMLGTTPSGDAYTFSEFDRMFRNAGFTRSEFHPLPPTPESVIVSYK